MESKMQCLLASIFHPFGEIWEAKLGPKIHQKSIKKSIEKRWKKEEHRGSKKVAMCPSRADPRHAQRRPPSRTRKRGAAPEPLPPSNTTLFFSGGFRDTAPQASLLPENVFFSPQLNFALRALTSFCKKENCS